MAEAIVAQGLTKVYKGHLGDSVVAVDGVDFKVEQGEIYGFIGPNGAGKTTTIKMLLGLIFPSSGKATILGKPAGDIEAKKQISYLPESPYFYDHMTGVEILDFYCKLFRMDGATRKRKIGELLEQVGLSRDGNRALRNYSKGMLQRIGIAQALINDPRLLFMDEPTSGLDPIAHKDIQDLIFSLKQQGKTVFLSSHQLSDVETVCDKVSIINRGKIAKTGKMEELLHIGRTVVTFAKPQGNLADVLKPISERVSVDGDLLKVYVESEDGTHAVIETARGKAALVSVVPQKQTLEDLFVEIIREVRE